jgi:uncharacterized protein (TIGR02265 family)
MSHVNSSVTPSAFEGRESAYARYVTLPIASDTVRGLFFNGFLNVVKTHGGEQSLKQCLALLGDRRFERSFISFSSYPATDFLRLAVAASQVLAPRLGGPEITARAMGRATVRDFMESMAGKTLLMLSGGAPQRLVASISSAYRAAVSFGERRVTPVGAKSAHISFKRDFLPLAHTEGVLLAVLEASTARNPQIRSRSVGTLDSEYDLSWD